MRGLPFFKPKNKPQFAGLNFSDASSSGGGGGGGGGSTFPDLSTDETSTGLKDVDGKYIYMKVFTTLTVEDNYSRVISISDLYKILDIHGYIQHGNYQYGLQYWTLYTSNDIRVSTYSQLSSEDTNGEIIVFYTKATD